MERELLEMILEVTGKDFGTLDAALEAYTARELFAMWLEYEGITGYTDTILTMAGQIKKPAQGGRKGVGDGIKKNSDC